MSLELAVFPERVWSVSGVRVCCNFMVKCECINPRPRPHRARLALALAKQSIIAHLQRANDARQQARVRLRVDEAPRGRALRAPEAAVAPVDRVHEGHRSRHLTSLDKPDFSQILSNLYLLKK